MKRSFLKPAAVLVLLAASFGLKAQNSSVAIGTSTPNTKAVLLLVGGSKDQGLIIPVVSSTTAVGAGATEKGMIVFNESDGQIWYHDGTAWKQVGAGGGASTISISGNVITVGSSTINLASVAPTTAGQILMWNGVNWTSSSATTPNSGNVLQWNGSNWVPVPAAGGGDMFKITYDNSTNGTVTNVVDNSEKIAGKTWPADASGVLQNNGGTLSWAAGGTVTSVGLSLPSIFSVAGSPVTTAGTLNATLSSQAANTIFAAPNGSAGVPGFRALVAADIPNISATAITSGTLTPSRGGTGLSLATPANGSLLIGNGAGFANAPLTAGSGINITNGAGTISISSTGLTNPLTTTGDLIYGVGTTPTRLAGAAGFLRSTGAVAPVWSSVGLASADVSGTLPITNGGTGSSSTSQNFVFAGPTGGAGAPSFRGLVAGDIPNLDASKITTGTLGFANGGTGATAFTANVVPRSNGTSFVTSNILSSATGDVAIGVAPSISSALTVNNSTLNHGQAIYATNTRAGVLSNTASRGDASGSTANNYGIYGNAFTALSNSYGVYGTAGTAANAYGVQGLSSGIVTTAGYGVRGTASGAAPINYGVYGDASGGTINWAGFFSGNTAITGGLAVGPANNFGTLGQILTSAGTGLAPTWSTIAASIAPINTVIRGNATGSAQVASSIFDDGLYTAIDRSTPIGSSRFDIGTNAVSGSYGGMYIDTQAGGKPFYGFSQAGSGTAWIELDGGDANKMKFVNAGTQMTIQTNGFTGIGTTTPSTQLEVSATSPTLTLRTTGAGVNETASLRIVDGAGSLIGSIGDPGSGTYMELVSPTSMVFNTNFFPRATISNAGNFIINAPASGTALDVSTANNFNLNSTEGDFKLGSATNRLKFGVALSGGGAGDAYIASHGGTNRLFLGTADTFANTQTLTIAGGNLGVGIISPTSPFMVLPGTFNPGAGNGDTELFHNGSNFGSAAFVNSSSGGDGTGTLYVTAKIAGVESNPTGSNNYGVWGHQHGTGAGGWGLIASNGASTTVPDTYASLGGTLYSGIFMGGNVGIGTATPTRLLTVNGEAQATRYFFTSGEYIFSIGGSYSGITDHWIPNNNNLQDLGTASFRWRNIYLNNNPIVISDRRLKKNIRPLGYGMQEIMALKPVYYQMNNNTMPNDPTYLGFIAQEVKKVLPEVVETDTTKEQMMGMRYTELIPVLVNAIQEQQITIQTQSEEIEKLKSDISKIKEMLGLEANAPRKKK